MCCLRVFGSFIFAGELKKKLAEPTGLHPQDQKLIFKDKERDSKAFLDVARVKDGSKIVLVEDVASRERRCLEKLRNAKVEKASKSLAEINLAVDKLQVQVKFCFNTKKIFVFWTQNSNGLLWY